MIKEILQTTEAGALIVANVVPSHQPTILRASIAELLSQHLYAGQVVETSGRWGRKVSASCQPAAPGSFYNESYWLNGNDGEGLVVKLSTHAGSSCATLYGFTSSSLFPQGQEVQIRGRITPDSLDDQISPVDIQIERAQVLKR